MYSVCVIIYANKDYYYYYNKINDLKCYLSTLNIDFSIIGLSENWGKQDTIDLRNLHGYIHHHYIRSDERGRGVSLSIC